MAPEETNLDKPTRRVSVLLPLPLDGAYDYRVSEGADLAPGTWVDVPLGSRTLVGVVWGPGDATVPDARLKEVGAALSAPAMPETLRRLIDWVANYTLSPPGAVLRMAMSVPEALEEPAPRIAVRRAAATPERLSPTRARVLNAAADGVPREIGELALEAAVGRSVVKALVAQGALEAIVLPRDPPFAIPDPDLSGPTLSTAQEDAAGNLMAKVRSRAA